MTSEQTMPKCGSCAMRAQDEAHCGLTGFPIDISKDFCSRHTTELQICEICGSPIVGSGILDLVGDEVHQICQKCGSLTSTCALCNSAAHCDFQENPIPLPQMIQQRIQQGPAIMMTMVKNPERVKETCEKNCGCFDSEIGCLRECGTCGKVKFTYKTK